MNVFENYDYGTTVTGYDNVRIVADFISYSFGRIEGLADYNFQYPGYFHDLMNLDRNIRYDIYTPEMFDEAAETSMSGEDLSNFKAALEGPTGTITSWQNL